jgi:hypothetical protein
MALFTAIEVGLYQRELASNSISVNRVRNNLKD